MVAEIFFAGAAIFAGLVGFVQPGDSYAGAKGESSRALAEFFYDADYLMSWDHWRFARREFSFDYVQIGAADSAHFYAHEDFTCSGMWIGGVGEVEGIGLDWGGGAQEAGFHVCLLAHSFYIQERFFDCACPTEIWEAISEEKSRRHAPLRMTSKPRTA
jgi:hypothetical protein